jgi:hypothetical protein
MSEIDWNNLSDDEIGAIIKHAVEVEHPGSGCPCSICLELFP